MESQASFVRQAAILGGAALAVRLLGFFYRIPLTNLIGDEGNAYYLLAAQVFSLAIICQHVAIKTAVVKLTSERIARAEFQNAHKLFITAMGFTVLVGLIFSVSLFLFSDQVARIFALDEASSALRAISPSVFFVSIAAVIFGYFQGMKTALPTAICQIIDQFFKATFAVVLAFVFFDPLRVYIPAAAATLGTTIGAFIALVVVAAIYAKKRRHIKKTDEVPKVAEMRVAQLKQLSYTIMPIYAGVMVFAVANLVDIRMVSDRLLASGAFSAEQVRVLVGQFTGKFVLLTTLPVSLAMALSIAVLPEISSSQTRLDTEAIRSKTNRALRLSMNLTFPSAVGLSILAYPILGLMFPNYPEGGILLQIGAISMVFMAAFLITQSVLQGVGHTWLPAISALCGLIVKVPINHFLIYDVRFNVTGVVISTVVCYFVASAINLVFIKRYVGFAIDIKGAALKPLISSLIMGVVCFAVYRGLSVAVPSQLAVLVSITCGVITYLIMQIVQKGIEQSEITVIPMPAKLKQLIVNLLYPPKK